MVQYSCLESPLFDREALQATVYRVAKSQTCINTRLFFFFFACGSSAPARVECEGGAACRNPGGAKCAGTWTTSAAGVMGLSESFFKPVVAGNQKDSLASLSL